MKRISVRTGLSVDADNTETLIKNGDLIKCEECGRAFVRITVTHLRNKCTGKIKTLEQYTSLYPESPILTEANAKATTLTLETFKLRYGDEEGQKRWDEYRGKQSFSNSFEYKKEKHGWDEEQYKRFNSSRAVTLENLMIKYGAEIGEKIYTSYVERQRETCKLDYFIKEYGEIIGKEKFEKFSKSRSFANSVNSSLIEVECYDKLKEVIPELQFHVKIEGCGLYADFDYGSVERKKLIEFYGDFWHCNPSKYNADYYHRYKVMTAQQIWSRDKAKRTMANNRGFMVYVIWEMDWRKNMDAVIGDVVEWWRENEQY